MQLQFSKNFKIMKNYLLKSTAFSFFVLAFSMGTSAQEIGETDLKINVQELTNSIDQLKNLEPVAFSYNTEKFKGLALPDGDRYGFLASNVKTVFPNMVRQEAKAVSVGKNTNKIARFDGVDTEGLIPVLVAAIKEQQAQIDELKREIEQLKVKDL